MRSLNRTLLLFVVLTTLGMWGCSQSGGNPQATAAKLRQMESRNSKLDEDYRASIADVNALRKKLADAEKRCEQITRQNQELQNAAKERDELQQKLTQSAEERDALRVQLTAFSKDLQSLTLRVQDVAGKVNSSSILSTVSQQK